MHVFLTGEKHVGKSTIIRRVVSLSGLAADGFMTYWESDGSRVRSLTPSPAEPDGNASRSLTHSPAEPDGNASRSLTHSPAEPDGNASRSLFLSPYSADLRQVEKRLLAKSAGYGRIMREGATSVFDGYGCEILSASGKSDVIIMDELGFLESEAEAFQRAIMGHIAGSVRILGVIKPARTEFLDAVRSHPTVETLEVTTENRDAVLESLLERFAVCRPKWPAAHADCSLQSAY